MASVPFMPNYTARNENKRTREVITNTEWNELWNLNSAQGDHSEKYLDDLSKFLFTSAGFDNTRTNVIAIIEGKADTHIARKDNPHEVKANQVPNTAITDLTATNVQSSLAEINGVLWEHKRRTDNPHTVTKAQVGLGNCDNTSDANKPISTAAEARFVNEHNTIWAETARIDNAKIEKSVITTVLGSDHSTLPTSKAVSDAMMEAGALPAGGLRGQSLTKKSDTNYDAEWHTVMPLGGTQGYFLGKASNTDLDVTWLPPVPNGGLAHQALIKRTDANTEVEWHDIAWYAANGVTTGTDTAFILNAPEGYTLADGDLIKFKLHIDSGATPTIQVGNNAPKAIMMSTTKPLKVTEAGLWLTAIYSGVFDFFILQGSSNDSIKTRNTYQKMLTNTFGVRGMF